MSRSSLGNVTVPVALLRMVPFVERNYNLVELGPTEPEFTMLTSPSH